MVGITQSQAETRLAAWLELEAALTVHETVSITTSAGSRTYTRSDLDQIRRHINFWEQKALRRARGGLSAVGIIPNG